MAYRNDTCPDGGVNFFCGKNGKKVTELFFHPVVCKQFRWPLSIDTESRITIRNLAQLMKVIKQALKEEDKSHRLFAAISSAMTIL